MFLDFLSIWLHFLPFSFLVSQFSLKYITNVPGIVTAIASNGFYLQNPNPDNNDATSEGIFVFTPSAPTVKVGDSVTVTGTVSEFTPGGASTGNLSITQIGGNPAITVLSSGNRLPTATIIGNSGRIPPTQVIDDDGLTSFDPSTNGIDFHESLEGMRVTARNAVAVSGTNSFGEFSDHDPLLASLEIGQPKFTLQLLHASDFEAGLQALDDAPRFSAVLNALKDDYANTLILSSGDNYIPSPFLFAGSDPSLASTPVGVPGIGHADIEILNQLEIQASAFGNHEFDLGTREVRDIIRATETYPGTLFPYLSANLNLSTDPNLAGQVTANGQEASTIPPGCIAENSVITVNGEKIGIVGATTPTLASISSPGGVTVLPSNPIDYDVLAAEIQASVDQLKATGINKIVLLSHMQQLTIEVDELAPRLRNVDIIVAGGSHTLLSDATDRLRAGDTSGGVYPILKTDADGKWIAVVNTDANYKYVGRLVVDFDANGEIIPDSIDANISGAYATDEQGVQAVGGTPDPEIVQITNALRNVINTQDGNIFGRTDVFLRGDRTFVRTEETNLGNLTADANLAYVREVDANVVISFKNGGGIRSNIGVIEAAGGSTDPNDFDLLPPAANPSADKEEGDISQLDITNSLRFNNGLTMITVTASQLLQVVEHGVAGTTPGQTPGQFPQVSGIKFSFDATRPSGDRISSLTVIDDHGRIIDVVVQNGELFGNPDRTFRMVTLNFLANGGDSYPFANFVNDNPILANRVDLLGEIDTNGNGILDANEDLNRNGKFDTALTQPSPGVANFAAFGSEQDALAEYLAKNFPADDNPNTPVFGQADVGANLDTRIQNLAFRSDDVLKGIVPGNAGNKGFSGRR